MISANKLQKRTSARIAAAEARAAAATAKEPEDNHGGATATKKKSKPRRPGASPGLEVKRPLTDRDREAVASIVLGKYEAFLRSSIDPYASFDRRVDQIAEAFGGRYAMRHESPGDPKIHAWAGGMMCSIEDRAELILWPDVLELLGRGADSLADDETEHAARNDEAEEESSHDAPTSTKRNSGAPPQPPVAASRPAGGIPSADSEPRSTDVLRSTMIDVADVDPNPFQPRLNFDGEELAGLAASLEAHGQLAPIVVRLTPGDWSRYQLVDGERRLRAAKLVEWRQIRADIVVQTDAEMAELAMVANVQRSSLNPIEQARALKGLKETHGYSQERLGQVADVGGQAKVSILLRLLELPEAWQQRIAAGKLSVSHARCVLPFADSPQVLAALLEAVDTNTPFWRRHEESGDFGSLATWRDGVGRTIANLGVCLDEGKWVGSLGKYVTFEPTAEQLERLDVVAIEFEGGETGRFALNKPLYQELLAAHVATLIAKADKRAGKASAKAKVEADTLSPAAIKAKASFRAAQLKRRVAEWKERWIRSLVSREFAAPPDGLSDVARSIALGLSLLNATSNGEGGYRDGQLRSQRGKLLAKTIPGARSGRLGLCGLLPPVPEDYSLLIESSYAAAVDWLRYDAKTVDLHVAIADVVTIAEAMQIDLAAEWIKDAAGWLTEEWLALHGKDELAAMAERLRVDVRLCRSIDGAKKSELVGELLDWPALRDHLPAEIAASEPWPVAAKKKLNTKGTKDTKGKKKAKARA